MGKIAPEPATPGKAAKLLGLANQLEGKLEELDALGAHIAAAHVDAAISRIREDQRGG